MAFHPDNILLYSRAGSEGGGVGETVAIFVLRIPERDWSLKH